MVLFAPICWIRLGLAASGALVLATWARGDLSPEQDALATVAYFNQLWSEDSMSALPEIRSMYALEVEFYGSVVSVEDVMADKVALAERWTERDYSLDRAASTAFCASPTSCLVDGEVVLASRTADVILPLFDWTLRRLRFGRR